jgi:hypothetical protein
MHELVEHGELAFKKESELDTRKRAKSRGSCWHYLLFATEL